MASDPDPKQPPDFDFGMTDLEERLRGPGGATLCRELLVRVDKLHGEKSAEIAAGLPPGSFGKADTIKNSLAAARDLLLRLSRLHSTG